jgi:carboxyl-terminal processing protease
MVFKALNEQIQQVKDLKDRYENTLESIDDLTNTASEIAALVEAYEINDYDLEEASNWALSYYIAGLNDKYAYYLTASDAETDYNSDRGNRSGIGVMVVTTDEGLKVTKVYSGSCAEEAGIQVGDLITAADGEDFDISNSSSFISGISGDTGTYVDLSIVRDDEEIEISSCRGDYTYNSVEYEIIEGNIAHVTIEKFNIGTADEFIDAMTTLKNQGINDYILDLRGNSGGYLDEVAEMVDFMVPAGDIITITDKNGDITDVISSDASEFDGNIVVIVNGQSASASEFFTQNLKDFGKATVVGTHTYGKGTVLSTFTLSNGGSLAISTGLYTTYSGYCPEGVGVEIDYEVDIPEDVTSYLLLDTDSDPQIQKAIEVLREES